MKTKVLVGACVALLTWLALPVVGADPFIGYNGHQYALTSNHGTWAECEAEAMTAGGHLVTINDSGENAWLTEFIRDAYSRNGSHNGTWIGLKWNAGDKTNLNSWGWADGTPATYWNPDTRWDNGEHMYLIGPHHPVVPGKWGFNSIHNTNYNDMLMGIIEVAPPPQYLFTTRNVSAYYGYSHGEGAFGISQWHNSIHAESCVYGNAVETGLGWQSTRGWTPITDTLGEFTGDHWKIFNPSEIVLGQRSQLGFVPGTQLKLFGYEAFGYDERERTLFTSSKGSFGIQDLTGTVCIFAQISYKLDVNGEAYDEDAASVINFVSSIASDGRTAIAKGSGKLLVRAVGEGILANVLGSIAETGLNPIAAVSQAKATTEMSLELEQDGTPVSYLGKLNHSYTIDHMAGEHHGGWRHLESSAYIDPTKEVDFKIKLYTTSNCTGASNIYSGITDYRVTFDVNGVSDVPLVYEFHDPVPVPDAASRYKNFLLATVNTADLTMGDIVVADSWGSFAPQTGDSVIILENTEVTGFLMPLQLIDTDTEIVLSIGGAISDLANAQDAHLQISYVYLNDNGDEEVIDLVDSGLLDLFDFTLVSGIAEMPLGSEWTMLSIDASALPRTDGNLLVAFGNITPTDLQAGLVIDSIAPVPEPATLSLLALGGLALIRRRRK